MSRQDRIKKKEETERRGNMPPQESRMHSWPSTSRHFGALLSLLAVYFVPVPVSDSAFVEQKALSSFVYWRSREDNIRKSNVNKCWPALMSVLAFIGLDLMMPSWTNENSESVKERIDE